LLSSMMLGVLWGTEEKSKPALSASPYWAQVERAMGSMNVSGALRLSYPLGEVQTLQILGLRCILEHALESDANGRARSTWRITGLKTSLVPTDRKHLQWHPLIGPSVIFDQAKIERALSEAGNPRWLIREATENEYEIRALDGRAWRYKRGVLIAVEHPSLGTVKVLMQGGLVREIRQTDVASDAPALLIAEYNEQARLIVLTLAGIGTHRFGWDALGQLVSWQRADGAEVHFSYTDGLLSAVSGPNKESRHFTWTENLGSGRGDARWAYPVHLASDEINDYMYDLSSSGFIMNCRDRATHAKTVTIFNPLRRRIEQTSGDSTLIVTLHKRMGLSRSGLENITTNTGVILEAYSYDDKDQLIGLKRKGQPDRQFTYDDLGRIMALDEVQLPQL